MSGVPGYTMAQLLRLASELFVAGHGSPQLCFSLAKSFLDQAHKEGAL